MYLIPHSPHSHGCASLVQVPLWCNIGPRGFNPLYPRPIPDTPDVCFAVACTLHHCTSHAGEFCCSYTQNILCLLLLWTYKKESVYIHTGMHDLVGLLRLFIIIHKDSPWDSWLALLLANGHLCLIHAQSLHKLLLPLLHNCWLLLKWSFLTLFWVSQLLWFCVMLLVSHMASK